MLFKGEPKRYKKAHHFRKKEPKMEYKTKDCGYKTLCWIWDGHIRDDGYAVVGTPAARKLRFAHRVFFESNRGPIPVGKHTDHLCRVRCCVNPWHLELVTNQVNVQRGALAKLTPSKVLQIRDMYATGRYTHVTLGQAIGVSATTVGRVVTRRTWSNI